MNISGKESRTKNSIMNLMYALLGQVVNIVVKFGLRTIFIWSLGKEYLGINGLFTNILTLLSLAELGVGAAITFSLYEPIEKGDSEKIAVLMRLFQRAYIAIGCGVLTVGIAITPFLKYLVSEMPDINNISLIYILFVINSSVSYFFSYKSTFITANQKNYIVTNITNSFFVLTSIAQALALLLSKNYILYLVIQIAGTLLTYLTISCIADKKYPVLKKKTDKKLDEKTKEIVIQNIEATIFHRIGGNVVFSTDNILLSKMFGIIDVGLYSNYSLIVLTIERLINQFFSAITASVGNLRVSSNDEHQRQIYNKLFFVQFWIYAFSATALGVLLDPFIRIWLGDDFQMSKACVAFIVLNFYLKGMRQVNQVFNQTYGLLRRYKYSPLPEVLINIVASIGLAHYWGPVGIFAGTTISTVAIMFWKEPLVLFKWGFSYPLRLYFLNYVKYFLVFLFNCFLIKMIVSLLGVTGITELVVGIGLVLIIPNAIIWILFHKSKEFLFFKELTFRIMTRRKMRG